MKRIAIVSLSLLFALALALAGGQRATAQDAAAAAASTFTIDSGHSYVIFKIMHNEASWNYGRFNQPSGTIDIDPSDLTTASVQVTVAADNVDTGNGKRDEHVKSQDFLNAKQFPTITFKSTSVEAAPEGGNVYILKGDITLLGQTKPIEAKLTPTGRGQDRRGGTILGAEATFTLKRSDFGIDFMQGPLGDDVHVTVAVEAKGGA